MNDLFDHVVYPIAVAPAWIERSKGFTVIGSAEEIRFDIYEQMKGIRDTSRTGFDVLD